MRKKTLIFKDVLDYDGKEIKSISLDMELEGEKPQDTWGYESKNNKKVFSVCGTIVYKDKNEDKSWGQCLESVAKTSLKTDKLFCEVLRLWRLYHLNNLNAGTVKQELHLTKVGLLAANDYTEACESLKKVSLYTDGGYRYGSEWLYRAIPKKDLDTIRNIMTGEYK